MTSDIFLNPKPVRALVALRRSRDQMYGSKVSRKIDTTYAHTVKIINLLEDKGYIETEKKGRRRLLELTDQGQEVADLFGDILDRIEGHGHFTASA